jgi:hypothetical protein
LGASWAGRMGNLRGRLVRAGDTGDQGREGKWQMPDERRLRLLLLLLLLFLLLLCLILPLLFFLLRLLWLKFFFCRLLNDSPALSASLLALCLARRLLLVKCQLLACRCTL